MKVGLIARGEDRGLGHMTWDFYKHMAPDRTLLIDMGQLAREFTTHADRYPDATVVPFDGGTLPEGTVRDWLAGLDVVYSAETFYDWQLLQWAKDARVATVVHVMPEFWHGHQTPTMCWAPTDWRLDTLPAGTPVVPVPVAAPLDFAISPRGGGPLRVVHIAGHRALADRNGTLAFLTALRRVRGPLHVRIECQDKRMPSVIAGPGVTVERRLGGRPDRWAMYADADLLVLPRRFAGLCLPAQEAAVCGLGLVMTDCPPNPTTWPIMPIPARPGITVTMPCGGVRIHDPDPLALAGLINLLAGDEPTVHALQEAARQWARAHSWAELGPLYVHQLAEAANRV